MIYELRRPGCQGQAAGRLMKEYPEGITIIPAETRYRNERGRLNETVISIGNGSNYGGILNSVRRGERRAGSR